jgi:spore germination protein YaaH
VTARNYLHLPQPRAAVRWAACVLAFAVSVVMAEQTYVVRRGDTLYGIARNHGIASSRFAERNGLSNNHYVRRGERLVIPGQTSPATPPLPVFVQRAIDRAEVKPGRWK